MKNTRKLLGLIALAAVMALSMTALSLTGCPTPDLGGGDKTLSGSITISKSGETFTTGTELTAAYSGTEKVTYQWFKDDEAIEGATKDKFTPYEPGSYKVTVSVEGYTSKTSEAVTVGGNAFEDLSGDVTITPNTGVTTGTELTANYDGSEDVTYHWHMDGEPIPGVLSRDKYTPEEPGSYTVIVSADGYKPLTSDPVVVTGDPLTELPGTITITPNTGIITTGTKLTATYDGDEDVTYQWNRDGEAIDGKTEEEYTPEEAGSYTVTIHAANYKRKTSDAVNVILTFTTAPELTLERGNTFIQYTWTDSDPAADSYDVYWKLGDNVSAADLKTSGTKISPATSGGTITGLTNGSTYSVIVSANKEDYASKDSAVEKATPAAITVTFDKNHSDTTGWTDANPTTQQVTGNFINPLPQIPTRANNGFIGWNTEADGSGTALTSTTPVTANMTVYAQWQTLPTGAIIVTTNADTGAGSLRQAVTDATAGSTIFIEYGVGTISFASRLTINKNLTIQGNGATFTKAASWTTIDTNTQLLYINGSGITVSISRVWFKDGRATTNGAAINVNLGTLTLESCIFSNNQTNSSSATGGAVNNGGTLNLRGCTFYNNASSYRGGAVYSTGASAALNMAGNLFYGNTASTEVNGPTVYRGPSGTITSQGYNVSDTTPLVVVNSGSWTGQSTDKTINAMPMSPITFRLLSGSGAAGALTTLPVNYPSRDFYGSLIKVNGAAGAVQTAASGSGYALDLTIDNPAQGSVNISPAPNADGLVSGSVTLTAAPATGFAPQWMVNGVKQNNFNITLPLTLSGHTIVKVVFVRAVTSGNDTDAMGTLRYAITNAQDGDIISFTGQYTVALGSALPNLTKSVTIEGNGSTLTRAASWTSAGPLINFYYISSSATTVAIRRLHFKDGKGATNGGAITQSVGGTPTLESCIFSGNTATNGGAVYANGTMYIRGCTFYNNSGNRGGAVYLNAGLSNQVFMTGNLFYGNTANEGPVVYKGTSTSGSVTSRGYNVSDTTLVVEVAGGTAFVPQSTDKTISGIPISPVTFKPLSDGGAVGVITDTPTGGFPSLDFYGNPSTVPGAAAGAVQTIASGSGYILDLTVNSPALGSASASPSPNAEGFVSGSVTLTATPTAGASCVFSHWLINGVQQNGASYTFTPNSHTIVKAMFAREVTGTGDSETTPGTLRYALANAQGGEIIRFTGAYTVELGSPLPQITRSITIEGNGSTLTRGSGWSGTGNSAQLLYITSGIVNVSHVHFKGGRATTYGAAIYNAGTMTVESCIFSGNQTTQSTSYGGAVYTSGGMTLRGCTFYNNTTNAGRGGAVYLYYGTLRLAGNLFFGNTATNAGPVVYRDDGAVTSEGYNVSDGTLVIYGSGTYTPNANDKLLSELSITGDPFDTTTFAPVAGLKTVMPSTALTPFPATDFNNASRDWPGAPGAVK
jgi:uncharacterized repeat protein (TIGR02543 family)